MTTTANKVQEHKVNKELTCCWVRWSLDQTDPTPDADAAIKYRSNTVYHLITNHYLLAISGH